MFTIKEKDNIKVVLKTNSKENKNLETVKNKIYNITDEFNISLDLTVQIDDLISKDELKIEYYSKSSVSESIGDNYLNFLDKFLDLGAENSINTCPME